MGARIGYRIKDSEENLVVSLFSNSSHSTQFAEDVFANFVNPKSGVECPGLNELVELMLTARYQTAEGNHRTNDRIFWLVPANEASEDECEAVIVATSQGLAWDLERLSRN